MSAMEQVEGTILVVAASFIFATIGLVVKVDPLPLLATTEARFLVCWVVAVLCMLRFKARMGLNWFGPPPLRRLVLLKAALSFTWVTLWWAALRRAPLGNCIAIIYCGPILTSLWSVGLLGERLGRAFPFQAVLVIGGVALIVDPPFLHMGSPRQHGDYTFVFLGLLINSTVPIVTRQTRACSWIEVEHVCSFLASFVLNPFLLCAQYFVTGTVLELPRSAISETVLICTAAMGTFVGVGMETKGYQLAEPGKAAMFRYVEVPFAYFLQLVGTRTPLRPEALAGSALILASVAIGAMEQRRRQQEEVANTAGKEALLNDQGGNGQNGKV